MHGQHNIVPNGGFEEVDFPPIGWYYTGDDFTKTVKDWYSPTTSSPDYYGAGVIVPDSWKIKGFGKAAPFEGSGMAGITVYGCTEGKAHCREYIAVSLTENLVPQQNYRLSFYIKHLPNSRYIKTLGATVVGGKIELPLDTLLQLEPLVMLKDLSFEVDYKWVKVEGIFKVKQPKNHLIIGNFFDDANSEDMSSADDLGYGYYYIDQVELLKTPPYIPVPQAENVLHLGQTVFIRGLHFNTDKYLLDAPSRTLLDKIVVQLQRDDSMGIEIHGHTDSVGSAGYNAELSEKRAYSVYNYLQEKGIALESMRLFSHGEKRPVDSNNTEKGRYQNRRVEIIPFKKEKTVFK